MGSQSIRLRDDFQTAKLIPEFIPFLSIAKGSVGEVRTQLYVALDQKYIDEETFKRLLNRATEIGRMIGKLMNYLKKAKIKGTKYKQ
jgi:four helix bundle protein